MNYTQLQQRASESLQRDLYQESIALYEQCIEINPEELGNYWYLGLALMLQGNESLAQTVWTSVFLQGSPEQIDTWASDLVKIIDKAAVKYLKSERLSEAERLYLCILELDPDYADTYIGLGHIQIELGDYEEAIKTYTQFMKLDPDFPAAHFNLGFCFHNLGKYQQAIRSYQQATILKDDFISAYCHLAKCWYEQNDYYQAINIFQKTIKLDPNYVDAYIGLGVCLNLIQSTNSAIDCFQQALKIKPDHPILLSELAYCLDIIGNTETAIDYLNQAKEINPNVALIYYNLAFCLQRQGKIREAITNFERAAELESNWDIPQYHVKKLNQCLLANYHPKIEQGYNIWDAMLFKDDNVYRLFYLNGNPKAFPFWSVGEMAMAISKDLKQWQYQGVVLKPEAENEWESGRILAGSIYKENGIYYLFYSAASSHEILNEAIGLAISTDGINWQRHSSSPFLKLDKNFYGTYTTNHKGQRTPHNPWRDPYIVKDPDSGKYYMFMTTSVKGKDLFHKGCIGQAVADCIDGDYKALPPVLIPSLDQDNPQETIYAEMERPQIIYRNGKYHLFFSTGVLHINPKWIEKVGRDRITTSSLYWYVSDKITGPFEPVSEKPVVKGSEHTGLYGTSLIEGLDGKFFACGTDYKTITLEVSARFPVIWEGDHLEIIVDRES